MRRIDFIVVHCTDGNQNARIEDIIAEFRQKGWKNPGYHYVVTADGKIHKLLDDDRPSNGVAGHNSVCINVAYTGGVDMSDPKVPYLRKPRVDNRTDEQKKSLRSLLRMLRGRYPDAVIQGHRDFSPDTNRNGRIEPHEWTKLCPCFDAKAEYADI